MEMTVTKEKINTRRELLNKNFEQPIEMNIILPEYYPEIEKILSCKAEAFIASKSMEGNALLINGTSNAILIYQDADGNLNSFTAAAPFTKKIELNLAELSFMITAKPAVAYFNYKATSPKKVDVRGAINITLEIAANDAAEIVDRVKDGAVESEQQCMQGNRFFGSVEQNVFIEEELTVANERQPVKCILKTVKTCRVESCKVISNKVIVKGTLSCRVIYCNTANEIEELQAEIPFNQIMDFDGLDENCTCIADISLCGFDIATKTNYEGEIRTLILTATACICAEAYANSEMHFLSDAYSTRFETNLNKKEIDVQELTYQTEETFACKRTIEYPEEIQQIENCWGEVLNTMVRIEDGQAQISGSILVCALVRDSNRQCKIIERTIDYEWAKALEVENAENCSVKCEAMVSAMRCNLGGDGIEVHVELKMLCRVFTEKRVECIEALELCEDKPIKNTESIGAVLYFAKCGDHVWDIAKEHHTAKDLIMEYNHLEEDVIRENTALLLPIV